LHPLKNDAFARRTDIQDYFTSIFSGREGDIQRREGDIQDYFTSIFSAIGCLPRSATRSVARHIGPQRHLHQTRLPFVLPSATMVEKKGASTIT